MRFEEAVAELDRRQPETSPKPSLDRIQAICELIDHPELAYPTVHVAGTNGKTTTARVATEIACAHGLSTGLFTSPHLLSVRERLSFCGQPISEEEFAREWAHLSPFLELAEAESTDPATYFEAVTALAFLWFADKPVSLGVFEVGMGGTWDATNLVAGDVAVICEIALDHPELGSTIAEVAGEKAGVLKAGRVGVIREQPREAGQVIEARAAVVGCELLAEGVDWEVRTRSPAIGGQVFSVRGVRAQYEELFVPMFGEHAVRNSAAGLVAIEALLGRALDVDATREALGGVRSAGRLEIVGRAPLIVLDGAHNPAGSEALSASLREVFTWERLHLVVAISAGKDIAGVIEPLAALTDVAYVSPNNSGRSADPLQLADELSVSGARVEMFESVSAALDASRSRAADTDLILVTGSLYTVADARRALGIT